MSRIVVEKVPPLDQGQPPVREIGADLYALLIFALVIFAGCLFGIFTRPGGHLSAFWPANALMLGMMIRDRRLASPAGLLAAAAAYICADSVDGGALATTLLLTAANMAGVIAGYLFLSRLDAPDRRLARPLSVLFLVVGTALAASTAGMVGALVDPFLSGRSVMGGWVLWTVTELVNYIAILPVVLTWPDGGRPDRDASAAAARRALPAMLAPAIALAVSGIAGMLVGGPGAIGFPVPALLWCALVYTPFVTALVTLVFSTWTLLAIAMSYIVLSIDSNDWSTLMSIRMGVTMIALAPITVASVMATRNELMRHLKEMATRDQLTDVLNRGAFRSRAQQSLAELSKAGLPAAVLMLDIDHFKEINDTYGHAVGDRALAAFARLAARDLRRGDLIGRLGGEEFAILLTGASCRAASAMAERIRITFEQVSIELDDGRKVAATVSGGLAVADPAVADIDRLLLAADRSLYRAKQQGRNRIVSGGAGADPAPSDISGRVRRVSRAGPG